MVKESTYSQNPELKESTCSQNWEMQPGLTKRGNQMAGSENDAEAKDSLEAVEDEFNAGIGKRLEDRTVLDAESTQGQLNHLNWTLDNLDTRSKETGLRVVTNNVQRKFYGSVANMTETFENMSKM